jgi:hypothetical protein
MRRATWIGIGTTAALLALGGLAGSAVRSTVRVAGPGPIPGVAPAARSVGMLRATGRAAVRRAGSWVAEVAAARRIPRPPLGAARVAAAGVLAAAAAAGAVALGRARRSPRRRALDLIRRRVAPGRVARLTGLSRDAVRTLAALGDPPARNRSRRGAGEPRASAAPAVPRGAAAPASAARAGVSARPAGPRAAASAPVPARKEVPARKIHPASAAARALARRPSDAAPAPANPHPASRFAPWPSRRPGGGTARAMDRWARA